MSTELPDPGDPRGLELDVGRPEKVVLPDTEFIGRLPEYRVRLRPDGRWEVEVWSKSDAVLLNKISRKSREIRGQVVLLRGALADFDRIFNGRGAAETAGMAAFMGALHVLHREWLQCMDIAEHIRVSPRLIAAALDVSAPVFHWGERE